VIFKVDNATGVVLDWQKISTRKIILEKAFSLFGGIAIIIWFLCQQV
jgi:hypothetical protein